MSKLTRAAKRNISVGDIVTRGCKDEHIVTDIDYGNGLIEVKCIKSQEGDLLWSIVGDEDINLITRYRLVRRKKLF